MPAHRVSPRRGPLLLLVGMCACGNPTLSTSNPSAPAGHAGSMAKGATAAAERYLPLAVGARWSYHAVDTTTGTSAETESVVETLEDVGAAKAGTMAFHVRSTLAAGGSTINWQQDLGTSVVRHREQFLDPGGTLGSDYIFIPNRIRLDETPAHTQMGANWTESNVATVDDQRTHVTAQATYTIRWSVEAVNESVTVPAGTFSCLRVRRIQSGYSSSDETQWFARHVGKVKETGTGAGTETKELTGYSLP